MVGGGGGGGRLKSFHLPFSRSYEGDFRTDVHLNKFSDFSTVSAGFPQLLPHAKKTQNVMHLSLQINIRNQAKTAWK